MTEQLTDEDMQRLVAQHDAYQARAEAVATQIDAIQVSLFECEHASNTVDALKDADGADASSISVQAWLRRCQQMLQEIA